MSLALEGQHNDEKSFENSEHSHSSAIDPTASLRNVWSKFDRRIVPVAAIFYFLSFIDRTNVANAKVAGLTKDLKMTSYEYTVALTVTYVPYIAAELPSNLLLKSVGPPIMLSTMVFIWGIVCALQGLVTSYRGLLACRFFLGLIEGGLFPGLFLYLSGFYPRQRLQIRTTLFLSSASLAGAFSGLLAAGIVNMNGLKHRAGWSWIFIIEGSVTSCIGLLAYVLLPKSPVTAKFLTEEEKAYVTEVLTKDGVIARTSGGDDFSWIEILRAFTSVQVLLVGVTGFVGGVTLYGLAYFEPVIVASLGNFSDVKAQLMSVPPFAVGYVFSISSAYVADRYRIRGYVAILFNIVSIAGFAMFLRSKSHSVKYGSLFLSVTGVYASTGAVCAWMANNSTPHIRKASAIAFMFIMTNCGGILATWLLGDLSPAPSYTMATKVFLILVCISTAACVANILYLKRQNERKAAVRESGASIGDEPVWLGDKSAWFVYNL